ncbi:hypothetical protein [Pseudogemmobacter humi]|uniref:Uncharacterized protein n=1 Tax=Pseudogemmobacter humi TaxID=2483812 RepID=A0A3P5XMD0_9RHOB|nr:hypothetical protein [Pseudogemmobacter humi]VDC31938.1 hypothetical protein XINFAN_03236 [Pseudogemmobacter humi]
MARIFHPRGRDSAATPGLSATWGARALFLQCALAALPRALATGLAARVGRGLACLTFAACWLPGLFKPHFDHTRGFGDGLMELYWQPGVTPAAIAVGAGILWIATDREPN